jgi:RimJ/RimL family protein N-acetyltransferase
VESAVTRSRNLYLRTFQDEDAERMNQLRCDHDLSALVFGAQQIPESVAETIEWAQEWRKHPRHLMWAVCRREDDVAIGVATMEGIDRWNRTLWHGLNLFTQESRAKGLGTEGFALALDYIFNEMNYRVSYGEILASNMPARRISEKTGAEYIGGRRQAWFIHGRGEDTVLIVQRPERFNEVRAACLGLDP